MKTDEAMFQTGLPCNPRPFLNDLIEYVNQNGTASIKDDTAKRMLWILNAQAFGQMAIIDQSAEWMKLNDNWRSNG